jgi:hypothetical protein
MHFLGFRFAPPQAIIRRAFGAQASSEIQTYRGRRSVLVLLKQIFEKSKLPYSHLVVRRLLRVYCVTC